MKKSLMTLALCLAVPAAWGQSQARMGTGQMPESFKKFREKTLNNFNEYRDRVLENYDKFLEGTWEGLAAFNGEEYPAEPKPKEIPVAPPGLDLDAPSVIPDPVIVWAEPIVAPDPEHEKVPDVKMPGSKFPSVSPQTGVVPKVDPIVSPEPEHEKVPDVAMPGSKFPAVDPKTGKVPTVSPIEKPKSEPEPAQRPAMPGDYVPKRYPGGADFDFYGMSFNLPAPKVELLSTLREPKDYAQQWRNLVRDGYADRMVGPLRELIGDTGLNDYFLIELLQAYAKAAYPRVSGASRASLVHFLLNNLGYDARIGKGDNDGALLLIPIVQNRMYARRFLPIDGRNYYAFPDDSHAIEDLGLFWNVCQLPKGADAGRHFNLRIDGMRLPMKPHDFDVEYGGLRLKGTVNENLMKMVYRYPQMEMGEYAASSIMPELRQDLVRQVKEQLAGKPQLEQVNTLLRFIQKGFKYATDDDLHGFEKPYFVEECFYQPKCDCEDRAMMFSYLLWNALGVENHVINYPGHEATAVTLSTDLEGDSYNYDGKKFLISDPTFIGANTGRCMPTYKKTPPEIDFIYSTDQQ